MFDVNTAADVPEAGALGPLPTGADVGGALSLSAGLFATALAARSKGDMETPTHTRNGETDKGTVPAGTAGLAVPTPDDVTESTATLLGLGRLVSPDVDPLQVADLVSSPEESKAAGFDPVEADGGAEPGRQTWAVPPAGTPAAAVEGASVDSAEASSTATAAARSAMSADGAGPVEPGLVEPGTLGQTVHGRLGSPVIRVVADAVSTEGAVGEADFRVLRPPEDRVIRVQYGAYAEAVSADRRAVRGAAAGVL